MNKNESRRQANEARARADTWRALAKHYLAAYKLRGDQLRDRELAITAARQYRRTMRDVSYYMKRAQQ